MDRTHPRFIQAVLRTPLIYASRFRAYHRYIQAVASIPQVYTSRAHLTPGVCKPVQAHLSSIQAVSRTPIVFNTPSRAHPRYIQAVTSTPHVYASRVRHTPEPYKPCPSTLQFYSSTSQVYVSRVEHALIMTSTTLVKISLARAYFRSIQAVLSIPLVYIIHAKLE